MPFALSQWLAGVRLSLLCGAGDGGNIPKNSEGAQNRPPTRNSAIFQARATNGASHVGIPEKDSSALVQHVNDNELQSVDNKPSNSLHEYADLQHVLVHVARENGFTRPM